MLPRRLVAHDLEAFASGTMRFVDAAIVVVAAVLSYAIRHDTYVVPNLYLMAIMAAVGLTVNYMHIAGVYQFNNLTRLTTQVGLLSMSWTAVMLSLIAIAYFTQTSIAFSRAFALGWFALSFGGFVLARVLLLMQIDRWRAAGRLSLNIVVIGAGALGRQLLRHLTNLGPQQYRILGVYDDRMNDMAAVEGHPFRGTVDDLLRYVRHYPVDEILVAIPWQDSVEIQDVVKKLKVVPTNVKLCPDYVGWTLPARRFLPLAGIPMLAVLERPLSGWNLVLKALEDRVLAALLLILFAPVLGLVALSIRLDSPGSVLFRQKRYGFNNNPITVYKFRTMRADVPGDPRVPQARRNDPRVTRVGAVLRRSSLDELPQLLNVLKGEMSLVGPRPHAVEHNEQYAKIIDDYLSRHRVKPGITGWAQVNGLRGETDTPEKMARRVQFDLYYIDNWSLLFDLKILLLTPFLGFVNKNAY